MSDPTQDELEALLELQATDSRIRRLQHQLDDLPEQRELEAATARVQELGLELDDIRVELDRAGAQQRQLERETDVLTQRRDAERLRLYDGSVASARELKAVEAEIETTERRISEHEDLLFEALERVEELEGRLQRLDTDREGEQQRAATLQVARDAAAENLVAELDEAKATRQTQASALPGSLLERYEQVAKRTGGAAVGRLEANRCTACRIELSMADVGELYAGPPLATCPQCRRLLVVPA